MEVAALAKQGAAILAPTATPTPTGQPPSIGSFTPKTGASGTVVTVSGSGFTGATAAMVGSTSESFTVVNDSTLTFIATATGQVAVRGPAGTSFSPDSFTATGLPGPTPGPAPAPTTMPAAAPNPALAVKIAGGKLVDATGKVIQLRGMDCFGLETTAVHKWSPNNPWGDNGCNGPPDWNVIRNVWKANAIRLPLNEASWLGYMCYDYDGTPHDPDPGKNYQATVMTAVNAITAQGMAVILDAHWTAPNFTMLNGTVGPLTPMGQGPMTNTDHSIDFWKSIATTFKDFPNVIFDLYNEPDLPTYLAPGTDAWATLVNGGPAVSHQNNTQGGANYVIHQPWTVAGWNQLVAAIRATGATNVIMCAGLDFAKDQSGWLTHLPMDPLNQIACSVHLYPAYNTTWGTPAYSQPNYAPQVWTDLQSIIAAGHPVIVGETGDRCAPGTVGAPFLATVLPWVDANNASCLGWSWAVTAGTDDDLNKDAAGTPTDGYGVAFKNWLVNHP